MKILQLVLILLTYDIGGFYSSTQSLPCHTANGDNCTSSICPNTEVTYTCNIMNGTHCGITLWSLPDGTCSLKYIKNRQCMSKNANMCVSLTPTSDGHANESLTPGICGPYTANGILSTDCFSSDLMVKITAVMDGNIVTCYNKTMDGSINNTIASTTINVVGTPGAPKAMANTIGPDLIQVVVNPSSSGRGGLPTSYNVTISNSSYVYNKTTPAFPNGSAMINFTGAGLTNNTNYTISSVAINCAGPSNSSDPTTILVSWPAPTSSSGTSTTEDLNRGAIIGAVVGVVVLIDFLLK